VAGWFRSLEDRCERVTNPRHAPGCEAALCRYWTWRTAARTLLLAQGFSNNLIVRCHFVLPFGAPFPAARIISIGGPRRATNGRAFGSRPTLSKGHKTSHRPSVASGENSISERMPRALGEKRLVLNYNNNLEVRYSQLNVVLRDKPQIRLVEY
jgi:hypothetical protein